MSYLISIHRHPFLERPTESARPHRALQGEAVRLQPLRVFHRPEGQAQETPVNGSQPGSFLQVHIKRH